MDKKNSVLCLKLLSFLLKSNDIVPAGTPLKDVICGIKSMD
jgi:hypothetical protein